MPIYDYPIASRCPRFGTVAAHLITNPDVRFWQGAGKRLGFVRKPCKLPTLAGRD